MIDRTAALGIMNAWLTQQNEEYASQGFRRNFIVVESQVKEYWFGWVARLTTPELEADPESKNCLLVGPIVILRWTGEMRRLGTGRPPEVLLGKLEEKLLSEGFRPQTVALGE